MMSSNSIDTIRRINQVAREYYHNDNIAFEHTSYLRDCLKPLTLYFSRELSGEVSAGSSSTESPYLFSALSYKNDAGEIDFVRLEEGRDYEFATEQIESLFKPTIDSLLEAIQMKRSMSLTSTLLRDKRRGKDLFFYSGNPYPWPIMPREEKGIAKIAFFRISDLDFDSEFGGFYDHNLSHIAEFGRLLRAENDEPMDYDLQQAGTLLWYYRQLQEAYISGRRDKDCIVHFIRPSFIESGYNILLSLATNRRLDVDELSFIYLLIYRIVSQTVIEKTRQISSNYIFGIGHFLKHRISPVVSHLVAANNSLKKNYGIGEELQNSMLLADTALASANVLDLFGKALAKRATEKEYAEFSQTTIRRLLDNEVNLVEGFTKYYLDNNRIEIRGLITEIRELIKEEWGEEIQIQFDSRQDWQSLSIIPYIRFTDSLGRQIAVRL